MKGTFEDLRDSGALGASKAPTAMDPLPSAILEAQNAKIEELHALVLKQKEMLQRLGSEMVDDTKLTVSPAAVA